MKDNYPIVVFWSDEDGEFIADIPDLQHLSAGGDTPEDAVREVMIAREAWLAVARENGAILPDPRDSRFWPELMWKQLRRQTGLAANSANASESREAGAA